MDLPTDAIELVAPHCDIRERFDEIPPSARVRGIYIRGLENELDRRGLLGRYHDLFTDKKLGSFGYYPVQVYMLRLACAGALVTSPEEVHEGMYEVSRSNAAYFAKSLLGRALIRLLSRDPVRLSEQALAARRQIANYGSWELVRRGPSEIEVVYHNEYVWIDSALLGAAAGTYEICGVSPVLETKLIDRYNGSTVIRW